jgi:hypothetical protein
VSRAIPHDRFQDDLKISTASDISGAAPIRRGSAIAASVTVAGGPGTINIAQTHHRSENRERIMN